MGQPQFMPSSYLKYAEDFDGDGTRDIWSNHADVFASIANYLKAYGWDGEAIWGRQVRVPGAVAELAERAGSRGEGCRAERALSRRRYLAEWQAMGVRTVEPEPPGRGTRLLDAGDRSSSSTRTTKPSSATTAPTRTRSAWRCSAIASRCHETIPFRPHAPAFHSRSAAFLAGGRLGRRRRGRHGRRALLRRPAAHADCAHRHDTFVGLGGLSFELARRRASSR
jgi:hypothetical protein